MREHEMILEALRRRAGAELSDILFRHLRNKQLAAVDHLHEDPQRTFDTQAVASAIVEPLGMAILHAIV